MEHKYYYEDRLRTISLSSSLVFGTAVDNAIGVSLTTRNLGQALREFRRSFTRGTDNFGDPVYFPTASLKYLKHDLDVDLINSWNARKVKKGLCTKEWASLCRKGLLIVKSFHKNVLPKVEEVVAIQEHVELMNEEGDSLIGKCDFIVRIDGKIVMIDMKTASRLYKYDAVRTSPQLSMYYTGLKDRFKIDLCGYVVALKAIKKNKTKFCRICGFNGSGTSFRSCNNTIDEQRCNGEWNVKCYPEALIQILIDHIPDQFEQITLDSVISVNDGIKAKQYVKNLEACKRGYGMCEYYEYCMNGDMTGLRRKQ